MDKIISELPKEQLKKPTKAATKSAKKVTIKEEPKKTRGRPKKSEDVKVNQLTSAERKKQLDERKERGIRPIGRPKNPPVTKGLMRGAGNSKMLIWAGLVKTHALQTGSAIAPKKGTASYSMLRKLYDAELAKLKTADPDLTDCSDSPGSPSC